MFYERQVINCLKYLRQIKLVLPMQTIDINYSNNDKNYCNFVKKKKKLKIMCLTRERRKLGWMWSFTLWTSLSAHRTPATTPWRSETTCRGPRENCTYNIRDIVISISVSAAIILYNDNYDGDIVTSRDDCYNNLLNRQFNCCVY